MSGEANKPHVRRGVSRVIKRIALAIGGAIALLGAVFLAWINYMPGPPPLIQNAGLLPPVQRSITSMPGVYLGTPYGACTRILAIDGGGVRGIIPALILKRIESETGKPISKQFDLIAGTSTGAILALGLVKPSETDARQPAFRGSDIVSLYRDYASTVFPSSFFILRDLRRFLHPKYAPDGVDSVLERYFGDYMLGESVTPVLIPAYDIEDHERLWFSDLSNPELYMKDIALGATAAPTYLPPHRFAIQRGSLGIGRTFRKDTVTLVDGGLFANNPSAEAINYIERLQAQAPINRGNPDNSILLVSLGTGKLAPKKYSFDEVWGWGVVNWINPLLEIAFDDPAIDDQVEREMADRGPYFRLQTDLGGEPTPLDDSSKRSMQHLTDLTNQALDHANKDILQSIIYQLSLPRSSRCPAFRLPGPDFEVPDRRGTKANKTIKP